MASTRTQIHLALEHGQRLDALVERPDPDAALAETFGSLPDLELPPRSDWTRPQGATEARNR
jgi:hypothetical protein